MPKVKDKQKYTKNYSEELLQKALNEIQDGAPKKQMADKYKIIRSTLQFRLGFSFKKIEPGPNTYLTKEKETLNNDWICGSVTKGFTKKEDIQASVKEFLDKNPKENRFKEHTPGGR
ncbi:hypothetical protein JTB14_018583 [Gonioctena quinquepunctata]|nr:hypothetical protein JTB14_018583 [Gonioctena quinquepunctata]